MAKLKLGKYWVDIYVLYDRYLVAPASLTVTKTIHCNVLGPIYNWDTEVTELLSVQEMGLNLTLKA